MTLVSSGTISMGGTVTNQSIDVELGYSGTAQISLNDSAARTLAGIPSGAISLASFYGKSKAFISARPSPNSLATSIQGMCDGNSTFGATIDSTTVGNFEYTTTQSILILGDSNSYFTTQNLTNSDLAAGRTLYIRALWGYSNYGNAIGVAPAATTYAISIDGGTNFGTEISLTTSYAIYSYNIPSSIILNQIRVRFTTYYIIGGAIKYLTDYRNYGFVNCSDIVIY